MPRDPWLSERMAEYTYIRRAENDLHPAVQAAVKEFLTATGKALHAPPVTAASRDDDTNDPDLRGFPDDNVWQRAIDNHIRPATRRLFDNAYYRVVGAREGFEARRNRSNQHLSGLGQRLAGFRTTVWNRLRRAVGVGREQGETPEQIRARITSLIRAEEWDGQVMTMTRTETMTALNAGAFAGAYDEQERTGQAWTKRWQATDDQRVRHTHHEADGQIRPLHDPFDVGGAPLQFPGDPLGPPGEVINCRCAARYGPADDPSLTAASSPTRKDSAMATPAVTTEAPGPVQVSPSGRWRGVLGFMDEWSADQRMLAAPEQGVRSRPLPLPLLVQGTLANGHDGSKLGVGAIDRIWTDGNAVWGEGRFDMDDPLGAQLARKVGLGFIRFVSLDVDDATAQQVLVDAEGNVVNDGDPNDQSLAIGDVYSGWRVMGATLLAHPAFPNAAIALADSDGQALTAAAFAEIVGYDPEWGCVKQAGDGWEAADCQDPDAVPANPTGDGPFQPEGPAPTPEAGLSDLAADDEDPAPDDDADEPAPPPSDVEADADEAAEELDPNAPGSPGCVTQAEDGSWTPADCEAPGAVPANATGDGPADTATLAVTDTDAPAAPTHAGLVIKALDTGRILLIQRALDPEDPAAGMWEFPGGSIEGTETPQEAAYREFEEETGVTPPPDMDVTPGWTSSNGIYTTTIGTVPVEADVAINPETRDNPDGHAETVAWWNPDELPEMNALRPEVAQDTPWDMLAAVGAPTPDAPPADDGELASTPEDCEPCQAVTITAAATGTLAPGWSPPAEWFQPPTGNTGAHSITVDVTTGRVSGYLAAWGSCHVGYKNRCVPPPHSATDYAYFNIRPVQTSDGTVYCGLLTMGTGHASLSASANSALAHYDNTGTQAAVVRVGEDNHGIWAVGAVLPFLTEADRLRLSLASFSGDWREVRGGAELIAALAVNSPGFPLAAKRTGADNRTYALIAAGALQPEPPQAEPPFADGGILTTDPIGQHTVDPDVIAERVLAAMSARESRQSRAQAATTALSAFRQDATARAQAAAARRVQAARGKVVRVQRPKASEPPMELVGRGTLPSPSTQDIGLARNWVDQQGGLPSYIKRISKHLEEKGMDKGRAIATAVNAAKKMCASGDLNWPGIQQVNPGSKAEACAAVAKWEAMKAAARAS